MKKDRLFDRIMRVVGGGDRQELVKSGAHLGGDMFFTLQKSWIVGPYNELTGGTGLARRMRSEDALRDRIAVRQATIGRRADEKLPVGDRTIYGFRRQIEGLLARQLVLPPGQTPRIIQLFDQADKFYDDATLEAHHVVEKSMLGTLGLNQKELANHVAPCILIVLVHAPSGLAPLCFSTVARAVLTLRNNIAFPWNGGYAPSKPRGFRRNSGRCSALKNPNQNNK